MTSKDEKKLYRYLAEERYDEIDTTITLKNKWFISELKVKKDETEIKL